MAKAKSKKITMEDALVPVEEQPYEVPENWCWIHLLDAFDNVTDSKKKLPTKEYQEEGEYSIIDQGQEFVGGYTDCKDMVYDGDMPVIIFGDHTRCVKYVDFPFVQGADGVKVLSPKKFWDSKAFYYAIQSVEIPNMGYRRHYPLFKNFSIPVPPLPEQQRIVEQIESLFSKLDEAKEKLQMVIDSHEDRRVSVLHKAFEGELSRDWREKNNISKDTWNDKLFDDCIEKMQNGIAKRSGSEGILFGVLRLANLNEDDINLEDLREIKLTQKEQENYKLDPADVIMIRVNGSRENVGRQILIKDDANLAFCDHIIRIRFKKEILPDYMVLFSKTDTYRYYIDEHMVSSAGQNTISRKGLGELYITLPSYEEQKEIVYIVNSIIEKEIEIREKAEIVLNEIDFMKKSILSKAFRGELGTNDPSEESSIELLKQIIES